MSIGLEIAIEKLHEDEAGVEYSFFVREGRGGLSVRHPTGRPGRVSLSKATGQVVLLTGCPDDEDDVLFYRVSTALTKHWKAGCYPSVTQWAG